MIHKFKVVFVLGGPGSGKGTQSSLIQQKFKFKHLSAGQLLRDEKSRPHSQYGSTIEKFILEGKIVPSFITTKLLQSAIKSNENQFKHFLIDGYPRNIQNLMRWKEETKQFSSCPFVLHFKCSEEEMIKRLLKRAEESHRNDDNMQVIRKRLKTYYSQTKLVLDEFQRDTKVYHINSDETSTNIFGQVCPIFDNFLSKEKMV